MGLIEYITENVNIGGIIIGNIVQFILALVFLDKYAKLRRWIIIRFLKQPNYEIGLDNRYMLKRRIYKEKFVEIAEEIVKTSEEAWAEQHFKFDHTWKGTDLYVKLERTSKVNPIEFYIKPIGDVSSPHSFYTILLEARVVTKYNNLEKDFIDILANLNNIERLLINALYGWGAYLDTTTLTIKAENLKELKGFLEKVKAERLSGTIKDGKLSFDYYDNTIQISGKILSGGTPSVIIEWIKNLATYLG